MRVHADHQGERLVVAGDVFGGIAERGRATEFLEANEVGVIGTQREEQISAGLVAVVRAVVDDGGQTFACREDRLEMRFLGGDGRRRARGRAG